MDIITIDFESFWSTEYSLSKMSPLEYVLGDQFETISCSIKVNHYPTDVFFGHDKVSRAFASIQDRISRGLLVAHNMSGFDAYVCAYVYGLRPRMWGCTQAMARPVFAKTVGLSLAKLVEHFRLGRKNNAVLMQTKGKHLADFTTAELEDMKTYNREDTDQCYALFQQLKPYMSAKEMWQVDALTRMRVEPKFQVDTSLLETALSVERDQKRKHVLSLARTMRTTPGLECSDAVRTADTVETLEEAVRADLASAPKFSALLLALGAEVPTKLSPTNPDKEIPALAKSDEAFIALQEHDNPLVAAAARARLAVKSTLLETRINKFLTAAKMTGGTLPVPLRYAGADTTGRDSGEEYNCQNLPRIGGAPRTSDALRNSMRAPKGCVVVVADLSGIELRVNHFLWQVASSMQLFQEDAEGDLYKDFAAKRYGVGVSEVDKTQRQMGKVAHLGLGFGAGAPTFRVFAKTQYGLVIPEDEAVTVVDEWREAYAAIVQGWKSCNKAIARIQSGTEEAVDPWGLVHTCKEGLRLPSGRLIRYPDLRVETDGTWPDGRPRRSAFYAHGRHKARLTGPKMDENIVQALARDKICDDALEFYRASKLYPQLRVHDELVYVVPESEAQGVLDEVQKIMRTPPKWWPELVTWSEGDIAPTYGAAK